MRWGLKGVLTDWLLYHHVLPNAAHIFVQSDAMRGMLTKRGVLAQLMTPVPMGVSLLDAVAGIQPTPDPRLSGRRVLVYLGALERIRQPEIMLEAMVKVVEQFPDAILALVGGSQNAGDGAWLEREIVRLGLSHHVFVTGWLPTAEAHRYLRSAEIGLSPFPRSPALEVASPTKVGEYLAFGLPVVANDQPDQAKLVHQTQGGLCVRMDGAGFAAGIVTLLADPVAAREMGQRGRAAIAALRSYPVIAERLAATYRVLLTPSDA